MQTLRTHSGVAASALEFLILTNVRARALLLADWAEFNLESALWLIPPAHLKDGHHRAEPLRIPLAPRAMEILSQMRAASAGRHVFPGRGSNRPLGEMAMRVLLAKLNVGPDGQPVWLDPIQKRPIVPHGFRATFRTGRKSAPRRRMPRSKRRWAIRSAPRLNGRIVVPMSSRSAASSWRSGRHSAAGHRRRSSAGPSRGWAMHDDDGELAEILRKLRRTSRPLFRSQCGTYWGRTGRDEKTSSDCCQLSETSWSTSPSKSTIRETSIPRRS